MLVQAYIKGDGTIAVLDSDVCKVFDRAGRLTSDNVALTPDIVRGKSLYKAISILSSKGVVEIALFDEGDIRKYKGDYDITVNLINLGGYIRRIQTKGKIKDMNYTQMIFLYNSNENLDNIMRKVVK